MRVLEIALTNVMTHAASKVVLPSKGVVLVTGRNGSGKSSLIEAVSVGGWEEPLRRKPIWSADKASITLLAQVGTESMLISRSRTKSKTALSFSTASGEAPTYETKTKAQAALERLIGSHALWRRTSVFSSHDADHFTLATDGERKKLLEDILGLERFDAAHAAALKDRKEMERRLLDAKRDVSLADERKASAKARLADALERLEALPASYAVSDADVEALSGSILAAENDAATAQEEGNAARAKLNKLSAQLDAVEERLGRIDGMATCTLCAQSIPDQHRAAQRAQVDAEHAKHRPMIVSLEATVDRARVAHRRASTEASELREQRGQVRSALRAAREVEEQRRTLEDGVRKLREAVENAADASDEAREQAALLEREVIDLTAAERVLSLTGVRSYLLSQALSGVEEVANTWLARMAGTGLALRLQPYSEKATGGVKDSISLEVEGAGGGHGYRAASGGERRRIDIALMLALAEIAEAAVGVTGSTLFFDEVFDALDVDGVDAACAVLDELAADRCVIVISHNKDLSSRLTVAAHLVIDGGRVA